MTSYLNAVCTLKEDLKRTFNCIQVDGKFIDIAVGASTVWALGSNRDFYYRYTEPGSYKPFKDPRNRFPAWRNRFIGVDFGLLKRLQNRA
jgi:hypothetical protein